METNVTDLNVLLEQWKNVYGCKIDKPVAAGVSEAEKTQWPAELVSFYCACNGLSCEWLTILPREDSRNIKRTWDSIQRANNPQTTRFLGKDTALLSRFLIFASLDANQCAAFDRVNHTIWYEEGGELHETRLSLRDFIEAALKETKEL